MVGGPLGPYFQSERLDRYRTMAQRLIDSGRAYYCYCSPHELKAKREAAEAAGGAWRYDRTCCRLTPEERAEREQAAVPKAVRFRVPDGITRFDDLVHGPIEFDGGHLEDFVILRSDGHPTYQLSVVSDDVEMRITHVVRGDDHISNTPKQILLYQALDAPVPAFAHVPLILGPDKKRLSKRHGATSVTEYARQGYLPEAMVNFLALLGWSPGATDQEIFTRAALVEAFDLRGISGGNAVFNPEKLDWFNQQHLLQLAPDELVRRLRPEFEAAGVWDDSYVGDRRAWFSAVLELLRPRAKKLREFVEVGRFFFVDLPDYDPAAVAKHLHADGIGDVLARLDAAFAALSEFDPASTEAALRTVADATGVKAATLIHDVRVAVTGRTASPGLFDVLALLGRERTRVRIAAARRLISAPRG
jgi:glutamyl-tRNA synthetase